MRIIPAHDKSLYKCGGNTVPASSMSSSCNVDARNVLNCFAHIFGSYRFSSGDAAAFQISSNSSLSCSSWELLGATCLALLLGLRLT